MPPKEKLVGGATAAHAAPTSSSPVESHLHSSTEAGLLFWLKAATEEPASPTTEDAPATEPVPPQDVQRTLSDSVPSAAHKSPPTEVHARPNETAVASTNALPSPSSRARRRFVVYDVMPLFGSLLAGQLGPVVVDVQLQGHTRLLQHPQQFEATLRGYEKQSTGPLTEALGNVQPFFLVCNSVAGNTGVAPTDAATAAAAGPPSPSSSAALPPAPVLYTMDPSNHYPVVPLLAQLLHSPSVAKVLLHSRLLYRLLFLFLGTDRVDIQRVVDLTTWSELGRQLRPSLAAMHPIPVDGVVELADVQSSLPHEVRQLLEEETGTMTQQRRPLRRGSPHVDDDGSANAADAALTEDDSEDESVASSAYEDRSERNSSSTTSGDDSEEDGNDGIPEEAHSNSDAEGKAHNHSDKEGEASGEDAVALLHTIVPIPQQPLFSSDAAVTGGGGAKRPRQKPLNGHHRRQGRQRRRHRLGGCSTDAAALASVYGGLKCLALFYAEVLSAYFDNVTGAAVPSVQANATSAASSSSSPAPSLPSPAVRCRLSPSEWCVQRTYAAFMCEAMTYHGVFVNDAVFHGMNAMLNAQLQAIEDLAEGVLAAFLDRTSSGSADRRTAATTCMTAEHLHRCIAGGPAATLLTVHPKLDASLLRALAEESAVQQDAEVATQLRLACQLVCIWVAFQERTEVKQRITDMFGKVADRVQARVLEHSQDAPSGANHLQTPSSWCEMCFSVHPTWTLHNSSTGRIFSTLPNVQNLSKQPQLTTFPVQALRATPAHGSETSPPPPGAAGVPSVEDVQRWAHLAAVDTHASALLLPEQPHWTLRHLYRAPPGCVLVSFDFNQLELRVLAQLSGDTTLQQHLSSDVDVLTLTTASLLRLPTVDRVQPHQRQAVKVVVYGLLYGMGPKAMEERIGKLPQESSSDARGNASGGGDAHTNGDTTGSVSPLTAQQLIARFHQVYPRIESYLRETRQDGLHLFSVDTLSGRKSLTSATDANRRKQRAVAQAIQGGAADIVLCAMRAVHQQRHSLLPYLPAAPFALVMTIHDELIYAVPRVAVDEVAPTVKRILEDQARVLRLAVPLPVSVRVGTNFGALEGYHMD
ncbi:putative DNA polymerase theta (polymerase domain only) [Leptomonas pyrrhocoris]|uniref:DNA-directed DNA polymerase n=1 Tax=Leptomonas pyrrhocoris TaxID=157538 RepID=A0A0N0VER9_LEPPY|nr:putative DNA polymerase theta (polymerase domain only) [Leptomonas pyrrhocoris]KPA79121.1 putative DNA polymerase theta (polymerase domain only) [Leptomonas pyrrhocoris]|eukprot:XP_015657560.1 putative DNA polymerase theta (polymerase domain only) [Leptomonas pyrrhocoris]